jgi:hypothetical protein
MTTGVPATIDDPDARILVELQTRADRLWRGRNAGRPPGAACGETVIGEIAAGPGEVMVISRHVRAGRSPLFKARIWLVDPRGHRVPTKWGMSLPAAMLPRFAVLVAAALEAELADIAKAQAARGQGAPDGREKDDLPPWAGGGAGQPPR